MAMAKIKMPMEFIKAAPIALGVPGMALIASTKPEDIHSNLAAWARWLGIENVPSWLDAPGADRIFEVVSLLGVLTYVFASWGVPRLPRTTRMYPILMMCAGAFLFVGGLAWFVKINESQFGAATPAPIPKSAGITNQVENTVTPAPTVVPSGNNSTSTQSIHNSPQSIIGNNNTLYARSNSNERKYAGILKPHVEQIFSANGNVATRNIELGGDSGSIFSFEGVSDNKPVMQFFGRYNLDVKVVDGKIKVSTEVGTTNGELIAQIIQNEWMVSRPNSFDRNYNDDSLEVKDSRGKIVLQVRVLSDRMQIQGEWWDDHSFGIRIVKSDDPVRKGALFIPLGPNGNNKYSNVEIKPMFRYPSDLHLGELAP